MKMQTKMYQGDFAGSSYVDKDAVGKLGYKISNSALFDEFKNEKTSLGAITLTEISKLESCDLQRKIVPLKTQNLPEEKLVLKFEKVDTEELKNIEIKLDGD